MLDGVGVAFPNRNEHEQHGARDDKIVRLSERAFIDTRFHLALSLLAASAAAGGALAGVFIIAAAILLLSIAACPELNGRPAGSGPFSAIELGLLLWKSNARLGTGCNRLTTLAESAVAASMACLIIGAIALPLEAVAIAGAINLASLAALRLSLANIVRANVAVAN